MKIAELYTRLDARIPRELSCSWDNDGLMCCPDPDAEVKKVLIALDITAQIAEQAIAEKYDVILSHHPLIFRPLAALEPDDPVAKKVIRLLRAGVTAMSFHTRLDAVRGGVNDTLADALGLTEAVPFGEGGRIGYLPREMTLAQFAQTVKQVTGAPLVQVADAGIPVHRVAVLGGSGSDDVQAAADAGADTYLSGELKHNHLTDAPERGMNLLAAGHFFTEQPVCETLRRMVLELDPDVQAVVAQSNAVHVL